MQHIYNFAIIIISVYWKHLHKINLKLSYKCLTSIQVNLLYNIPYKMQKFGTAEFQTTEVL
jgi:hypothetical protein